MGHVQMRRFKNFMTALMSNFFYCNCNSKRGRAKGKRFCRSKSEGAGVVIQILSIGNEDVVSTVMIFRPRLENRENTQVVSYTYMKLANPIHMTRQLSMQLHMLSTKNQIIIRAEVHVAPCGRIGWWLLLSLFKHQLTLVLSSRAGLVGSLFCRVLCLVGDERKLQTWLARVFIFSRMMLWNRFRFRCSLYFFLLGGAKENRL